MSMHLVFVYGSLKAGFHNAPRLLPYAPGLGAAHTVGRYLLLKGAAFPYLINPEWLTEPVTLDGLLGHVDGELYQVDNAGLRDLDRLESHPRFYRREQVRIARAGDTNGEPDTYAWVYFLVSPSGRIDFRDLQRDERQVAMPDARGHVSWKLSDVWSDAADADAAEA